MKLELIPSWSNILEEMRKNRYNPIACGQKHEKKVKVVWSKLKS